MRSYLTVSLFLRRKFQTKKTDLNFSSRKLLPGWQNLTEKFRDYIFCTRIMSEDAVIFVTQAMPSARIKEDIIQANFQSNIVLKPQKKKVSEYCNSMPLSPQITVRWHFIRNQDLFNSAQSLKAFWLKTVTIWISFLTIKICSDKSFLKDFSSKHLLVFCRLSKFSTAQVSMRIFLTINFFTHKCNWKNLYVHK